MAESLEKTVTVELGDTDMARFIHFSSVVRYFDVGLRTVLEAADLTFQGLFDRGIGLPVVNVNFDYRKPMTYGDRLTIRPKVDDLGESTVTLGFTFTNQDDVTTADGSLTMAFYDIKEQRSTAIPEDVREQLEAVGE